MLSAFSSESFCIQEPRDSSSFSNAKEVSPGQYVDCLVRSDRVFAECLDSKERQTISKQPIEQDLSESFDKEVPQPAREHEAMQQQNPSEFEQKGLEQRRLE